MKSGPLSTTVAEVVMQRGIKQNAVQLVVVKFLYYHQPVALVLKA